MDGAQLSEIVELVVLDPVGVPGWVGGSSSGRSTVIGSETSLIGPVADGVRRIHRVVWVLPARSPVSENDTVVVEELWIEPTGVSPSR